MNVNCEGNDMPDKKETIGEKLLSDLGRTTNTVATLTDTLCSRLNKVSKLAPPRESVLGDKNKIASSYPKYFTQVKIYIDKLSTVSSLLSSALNRLEI